MQPDANGDWLVFESKVSGSTLTFSATQTGIADNAYEDNDEIADVNGDGRGDLVYATAPSSGEVNWYYRPNNGGSFGAPVPMFTDSDSTLLERTGATVNVSTRALGAAPDINGDHRTDLMLLSTNTVQPTCNTDGCTPPPPYDTYTWRMIPSGGFAGELSLSDSNNNAGIEDKSEPIFVDLNGDGMTDVAWDEPPDTNPTDSNPADWTWHIWLATGTGFTYAGDTGKLAPTPYAAIAIDYNHDGREDILYPDFAAGVWKVLLSTGNGLAGPYSTGIATHSDNQDYGVGAADVNGDGLPDFIVSENGSYEYAMHKGAMPHLLSGITDGFGNSITMQYAALPQTSAYTAATAPIGIYNESFAGALYVVTKDINSDGISGTYTRTYSYTGAAVNTAGYGFLGFATSNVTDSRNNATTTIDYEQDFPYSGLVNSTKEAIGSTVLKDVETTWTNLPVGSKDTHTDAYLPYPATVAETDNGADGATLRYIETTRSLDNYGNVIDKKVTTAPNASAGVIDTRETTASYADDRSTWCLSLPTQTIVTDTVAGAVSNTYNVRETDYQRDGSACREHQKTLAATGTTPKLTTVYTYDTWGNVASQTETDGGDQSVRETTFDYSGTGGAFIDSVTVGAGSAVAETATADWDPGLGIKMSTTDPNGGKTSYTYDGFGYLLSRTAPDLSTTSWTRTWCASGCSGTNGVYSVAVTRTNGSDSAGSAVDVYDSEDRVVRHMVARLGGETAYVDTKFDSLGRKVQQSAPYFSGDPIYWTTTVYDVENRPKSVTAPASESSPEGSQTTYSYTGDSTVITGPDKHATTRVENALGEITQVTDANSAITNYTYGPFGELQQVIDPASNTTTISYDARGDKLSLSDPDMGTWTYAYNAFGQLIAQTDAKNQETTLAYDALGRPTSRKFPMPTGGTGEDTWSYVTSGNGIGSLSAETAPNGFARSYSYDGYGRPTGITTTMDGTAYTVSTTYDDLSRVSTVTYPDSVPAEGSPVASAGAAQTVTVESQVTLNGSGSDPNGQGLNYFWQQTGGPSVVLSDPTSAQPTFTASSTQSPYTFKLTINNGFYSSSATTSVTAVPPAPTGLSVDPAPSTSGTFALSWNTSAQATSYKLQEATSSDFSNATVVYSGSAATATLSARGNGTYYYRVQACAASGCSDFSTSVTETVNLTPPGAVGAVTVSPSPSITGSYTVSWGAASGTMTNYELEEAASSDFSNATTIYSGMSTTAPVSGKPDGTWYYRVRACNGIACTSYTATVSETVLHVPGTPGTPVISPNPSTSGSYTVSWGAASGSVSSYQLEEATASDFSNATTIYSGTATSEPVAGKGNGTWYYRVEACNASGCSPYTGSASETVTLPPGTPGTPGASPDPSTNGSYTVSWGAASGQLTAYSLQEATNSSFSGATTIYSGTGTSHAVSGKGNGTYYYRVDACNGTACTGWSGTGTESVTLPPAAPGTPSISPSPSYSGAFTVAWSKPSGTVTSYTLQQSFNSGSWGTVYSGGSTSWGASGKGDGTYAYRVEACNQSACSSFSGSRSVTVTRVPAAPSLSRSPTGTIQSGTQFTVSWTAPSGPVSEYELESAWNSTFSGSSPQDMGTSRSVTYTASQVTDYATEYFRVRACNVAGCGGWSNTIQVLIHTSTSGGGGGGGGCDPTCPRDVQGSPTVQSPSTGTSTSGTGSSATSTSAPATPPPAGSGELSARLIALHHALALVGRADLVSTASVTNGSTLGSAQPISNAKAAWATAAGPASSAVRAVPKPDLLLRVARERRAALAVAAQPRPAGPSLAAAQAPQLQYSIWNPAQGSPFSGYAPTMAEALHAARLRAASSVSLGAFTVHYTYDSSGTVTSVYNDADPSQVFWQADLENAAGRITGATLGNGLTTVWTVDKSNGELDSIRTGVNTGDSVQALTYGYDPAGNLTSREDANAGLTEDFTLDALNRLKTATQNGAPSLTMGYDTAGLGNIVTRTGVGTYSYGTSQPHAVQGISGTLNTSFTYDADGNFMSGDGLSVTAWTAFNKPLEIDGPAGSVKFWYGPEFGEWKRVVDANGTTTTNYEIGRLWTLSVTGSEAVAHNYIVVNGAAVAVLNVTSVSGTPTTAALYYLHHDVLGSLNAVSNVSGQVVVRASFSAWGERRDPATWSGPPSAADLQTLESIADRGYTGHDELDVIGLVDMGGRIYNPQIGRFLSPDLFVQFPMYDQSFNRYSYVLNDPMSFVDPSGYLNKRLFIKGLVIAGLSIVAIIVAPEGAPLEGEGLDVGISTTIAGWGAKAVTAVNTIVPLAQGASDITNGATDESEQDVMAQLFGPAAPDIEALGLEDSLLGATPAALKTLELLRALAEHVHVSKKSETKSGRGSSGGGGRERGPNRAPGESGGTGSRVCYKFISPQTGWYDQASGTVEVFGHVSTVCVSGL